MFLKERSRDARRARIEPNTDDQPADARARVLTVSRDRQTLAALEGMLAGQPGLAVSLRHISNGHADPLHGVTVLPDVLLLHVGPGSRGELEALGARPAASRPPLLVVGPAGDTALMRLAMHTGARDYLTEPPGQEELLVALRRLLKETHGAARQPAGRLTAVMNTKGGSGATLLACNLAHIMAAHAAKKAVLVDLDIQFGTLPLYLDLHPKHGVREALEVIEELDAVALEGYMVRHASGLRVLGTMPDKIMLPQEIDSERLARLLDLLRGNFNEVVVDLPRQIDPMAVEVLEKADRIAVIVQQGLANVRDATRLLGVLKEELALPADRITVIVNRYQKTLPVTIADMETALRHAPLVPIPNDFKHVNESVNIGAPLYEHARHAEITQALLALSGQWCGEETGAPRGLWERAIAALRRT